MDNKIREKNEKATARQLVIRRLVDMDDELPEHVIEGVNDRWGLLKLETVVKDLELTLQMAVRMRELITEKEKNTEVGNE